MSLYEWENGTITLPAAEVPALKKMLRDWINAVHDEVRVAAVTMHKDVAKSTRSRDLYTQRLAEASMARYRLAERRTGYGSYGASARQERAVMVTELAAKALESMLRTTQRAGTPPRQPVVADVAAVVPKLTNRDNTFPLVSGGGISEARIVFDGRQVTWSVPENNHAVHYAHENPVAKLFFERLERIQWTRGTGGALTGNNEMNREGRESGGGANYTTLTFGPLGDEARIFDLMRSGFSRTEAKRMIQSASRSARVRGW